MPSLSTTGAHAAVAAIEIQNDWRIARVEPHACVLLNVVHRSSATLVGESFWSVFPALTGTATERKLRQAMRERLPQEFHLFYPASDCWLAVRATPLAVGLALFVDPISHPAEPTLLPTHRVPANSTREIDAAVAHVSDFVFSFDSHARLLFANTPLLAAWRVTLPQAALRPISALPYPPAVAARLGSLVQQVLDTGRPASDQMIVPVPDQEPECHETILNPMFGPDGAIVGVAGSTRVRPHHTIASSHHRADVLCQIAADLFVEESRRESFTGVFKRIARAIGAEGHVHHLARATERALLFGTGGGLSDEQLRSLATLPDPYSDCTTWMKRSAPLVLDRLSGEMDPAITPLRALRIRAFLCCPLKADGRLLGTLSLAAFVRERYTEDDVRFVQAACDLVAASMDRVRLVGELRASRDLAEQGSHAKDNFLAALSHELRTPLNPVLLLASSAAANGSLPPAVRSDFELIARNVTLETRLIDDLLDLTRISHGKLSLIKKRLDLNATVRDALATIQADVNDKSIQLDIDLTSLPVPVFADPVRMQQILWNLLKNAVKFTPVGGHVSVRTKVTNAVVRVEVADSGIGLTPDEVACAFDSFAQGEHAAQGRSQFGGLGLGLAIARQLVSLHAGRVYVTSAGRDRGACFSVELPLASESLSDPSAPSSTGPKSFVREGARILLVEDHQHTRQALLQLLVHRHYEVIAAASVAEARLIVTRKRFDLVISDIGLPDGSGYELMAGLRREFSLPGIALTGYGSDQDLAMARAAGFVAHLTKPVSIQALEAALTSVTTAAGFGT